MIATGPIQPALASGGDRRSRTPRQTASSEPTPAEDDPAAPEPLSAGDRPAPPLPAEPSGAAYVTAMLSAGLAPHAAASRHAYARSEEWAPPDSSLRLADKTA